MTKEQINEMKQFLQIAEGAWALPKSYEDFKELHDIIERGRANQLTIDQYKHRLYSVLGDDTLFDVLDGIEKRQGSDAPAEDAAEATIHWMQDQTYAEYTNYPHIWNDYQFAIENKPEEEVDEVYTAMNEDEVCEKCGIKGCTCGDECSCGGPAAQGKSAIMKDVAKEKGAKIRDLPLTREDVWEDVLLDYIVETILNDDRDPKDYYDPEEEETETEPKDFMDDYPEAEDEELGLRFD